jgi:uncharacterized protein YacL
VCSVNGKTVPAQKTSMCIPCTVLSSVFQWQYIICNDCITTCISITHHACSYSTILMIQPSSRPIMHCIRLVEYLVYAKYWIIDLRKVVSPYIYTYDKFCHWTDKCGAQLASPQLLHIGIGIVLTIVIAFLLHTVICFIPLVLISFIKDVIKVRLKYLYIVIYCN